MWEYSFLLVFIIHIEIHFKFKIIKFQNFDANRYVI